MRQRFIVFRCSGHFPNTHVTIQLNLSGDAFSLSIHQWCVYSKRSYCLEGLRKPAKGMRQEKGVIYKFHKFPYVLVYAVRQWSVKCDTLMLLESKLEKSFSVPQLFRKMLNINSNREDYRRFLSHGDERECLFINSLIEQHIFVNMVSIGGVFSLNGSKITMADVYTVFRMNHYIECVALVTLPIFSNMKQYSPLQRYNKTYCALAGTLMFHGKGGLR